MVISVFEICFVKNNSRGSPKGLISDPPHTELHMHHWVGAMPQNMSHDMTGTHCIQYLAELDEIPAGTLFRVLLWRTVNQTGHP